MSSLPASAQENSPLRIRDVAIGLSVPWEMVWGPDNQLWITEHPGLISRVDPETGRLRRLKDLRGFVWEAAESGMLSLGLDPSFPDSPYVYVVYTWRRRDSTVERLSRFTWDRGTDSLVSEWIMLDSIRGADFRNGSRLLIEPDRSLFMTTGDATVRARAQDPFSRNGKILRINLDGTVPRDNPWASAPWPSSLVWSLGHRNPQGLCRGPHGILYASEHGENDDDELNIIVPTWNYGWPNVHGLCDDTVNFVYDPKEREFCRDSLVVEPIRHWTPTIGPGSLFYYTSERIPLLTNSLLMITLGKQKPELPEASYSLVRMTLSPDGGHVLADSILLSRQLGRLRAICASPDGRIFLSTSNRDGRAIDSLGFPRTGDDRIVELVWDASSAPIEEANGIEATITPHPLQSRSVMSWEDVLGDGTWRIYDARGRTVKHGIFEGGNRLEIQRDALPAGMYTVVVADGHRQAVVRIVTE